MTVNKTGWIILYCIVLLNFYLGKDRIFDEEFVNNNLEDEIELKLNAKIHPWKKMK